MHRWDLGAALGRDPGYPDALAADGVDEVVTMFFPRQVRLQRTAPLSTSLAVVADGPSRPGCWPATAPGHGAAR